jgi:preprotein translocase subunit SecE
LLKAFKISKSKNEEVGVMERVLDYIRESRAELKKVTWPTKQQMWYSTLVVIVVTFMVSVYLGLVDLLLTGVFSKIVR